MDRSVITASCFANRADRPAIALGLTTTETKTTTTT